MQNACRNILLSSLAMLVAPQAALAAGHGKAGLWQYSVTMEGAGSGMPDFSKLPPEVQARMKAMGVGASGNTITVQHCMTAQQTAPIIPSTSARSSHACTQSNVSYAGNTFTADMTCTGKTTSIGHVHVVWDSNEHYIGEVSMSGTTSNGMQFSHSQKFEAHWISATCPPGQP